MAHCTPPHNARSLAITRFGRVSALSQRDAHLVDRSEVPDPSDPGSTARRHARWRAAPVIALCNQVRTNMAAAGKSGCAIPLDGIRTGSRRKAFPTERPVTHARYSGRHGVAGAWGRQTSTIALRRRLRRCRLQCHPCVERRHDALTGNRRYWTRLLRGPLRSALSRPRPICPPSLSVSSATDQLIAYSLLEPAMPTSWHLRAPCSTIRVGRSEMRRASCAQLESSEAISALQPSRYQVQPCSTIEEHLRLDAHIGHGPVTRRGR